MWADSRREFRVEEKTKIAKIEKGGGGGDMRGERSSSSMSGS